MAELFLLILLVVLILALLSGFPVAFAIGGASILVASVAACFGAFDMLMLGALPGRIFSIMTNETLLAVPLFVFMGAILERSRIAEEEGRGCCAPHPLVVPGSVTPGCLTSLLMIMTYLLTYLLTY